MSDMMSGMKVSDIKTSDRIKRAILLAAVATTAIVPAAPSARAETTADVVVPLSELEVWKPGMDEDFGDRKPGWFADGRVSLGVSTWQPSRFEAPSLSPDATAYKRGITPTIGAGWVSPVPFLDPERGLQLDLGISLLTMTRSGNTLSGRAEQEAWFVPMQVGARWSPWFAQLGPVVPYVGAGLLPTLYVSSRSTLDEGATGFGLPLQFTAGTVVNTPWIGVRGAFLDVSIVSTLGRVDGGEFVGTGVRAGFGLEM